jgi:hypothetical protein
VPVPPGCPQAGIVDRIVSGATSGDTIGAITSNDAICYLIVHDVAGSAALTWTIPTPTTLGNPNACVIVENHSSKLDTLKATGWTIQQGNQPAVAGATGIPVPPANRVVLTVDQFNATQWLADETTDTETDCAAAGTAANPSLVACGAAPSGSFSCSVSASTGTCVVSTTLVTAISEIFIQPTAGAGSKLSVTCNTSSDTGLTAPRLASWSAGTSFTINLGTFATNPECFDYFIKH